MNEDLETLVSDEFKRIGFMAKGTDVARLADALRAQGADFDEVAIMSACVGYATAKGARF